VSALITESEAETIAVGRELGRGLAAGDIVLLTGQLGSGKTAFVRGLAAGLGADGDAVSSPTFTIVQEYRGRVTLQHVDLYRLSAAEVDDLALDELMDGNVVAIEWPDRWRHPPDDAISVTLEVIGGDWRRITISRRPRHDR